MYYCEACCTKMTDRHRNSAKHKRITENKLCPGKGKESWCRVCRCSFEKKKVKEHVESANHLKRLKTVNHAEEVYAERARKAAEKLKKQQEKEKKEQEESKGELEEVV